VIDIGGNVYQKNRVNGSLAAKKSGSAALYGQEKNPTQKLAAQGNDAMKEVVVTVYRVQSHLICGIQTGMGYLRASNLEQLRTTARFIRVSGAGMTEASPHAVVELKTGY
jgi:IMP dehydrogenase